MGTRSSLPTAFNTDVFDGPVQTGRADLIEKTLQINPSERRKDGGGQDNSGHHGFNG
jgi:hypothetical protein